MTRMEWALVAAGLAGFLSAGLGACVVGSRWMTGAGLLLAGVAIAWLFHLVPPWSTRAKEDASQGMDPWVYWIAAGTIGLVALLDFLSR